MDLNSNSISPREFLTQAEQKYGKKIGWLIKVSLVVGGLGVLALVGPTLLGLMTLATTLLIKGIVLGGLIVILTLAYMFFTNPQVKAALADHWDGMIRSFINGAIPINVPDRLEAYADEYLQGKLDLVQRTRQFIKGLQNTHRDQVQQKSAELEELVRQATFRKKRSMDERTSQWKNDDQGVEDREEFRLLSDQISMLRDSLARLEKMGSRYEIFMALITKFERAFNLSIRKTRNIVRLVVDELSASENMAAAAEALGGVMEGTDPRTKMFDATMNYAVQTIGQNVAAIEGLFDRTRSIISSADLQSDLSEERLLHELSDMDQRTDAAISTLESHGESVSDIAARVARPSADDALRATASSPSGDGKYADLLRKVNRH